MTADLLLNAAGYLDDSLIEEAAAVRGAPLKRKPHILRHSLIAAALVAAVGLGWWTAARHGSGEKLTSAPTAPTLAPVTDNIPAMTGDDDNAGSYGRIYDSANGSADSSSGNAGAQNSDYKVTWTSEDGRMSFTCNNPYGMREIDGECLSGILKDENGTEHQMSIEAISDGESQTTGTIWIELNQNDYPDFVIQTILVGNYTIIDDNTFTVTVKDEGGIEVYDDNGYEFFSSLEEMENDPRYSDYAEKYGGYYIRSLYRTGDVITFRNNRPGLKFRNRTEEEKRSKQLHELFLSLGKPLSTFLSVRDQTVSCSLTRDALLTDGSGEYARATDNITLRLTDGCKVYAFSEDKNEWQNTGALPQNLEQSVVFLNIVSLTEENGTFVLLTDTIIL